MDGGDVSSGKTNPQRNGSACSGKIPGIPIFPLHALPFLWGFVFPLLTSPPFIAQYGIEARLEAVFVIALYLAVATMGCSAVLQIRSQPPIAYFVLPFEAGDRLLLSCTCLP